MPDPIDRLIAAAERTAAEADRLSARFGRELSAVWRQVERCLSPLIDLIDGGSPTVVTRMAAAQQLGQRFREVLRTAGYDDLADVATGEPLDAITARVLAGRAVAQLGAEIRFEGQQQLLALKNLHLSDLLDAADTVSKQLSGVAARGSLAGNSRGGLRRDLGDLLDTADSRIRTIYDTSVSMFGRQVEAIQAGDDPQTVFAFMGPVDDKTREFCLDHVGRVYTRQEIDGLDNGQLDNCFLTGGGFNCRHVWHEVSAFSDLQDLKGTTQRIPEIMDAVREARAAA